MAPKDVERQEMQVREPMPSKLPAKNALGAREAGVIRV
jgi:hypothetical protein